MWLCFVWDPPRKYGTVRQFLERHLEKHLFQVAPVPGTADGKKEDDKKDGKNYGKQDDKKDDKKEDEKDDEKEDKKVAASVASAASVGQRLSGRHLPLKLQALRVKDPTARSVKHNTEGKQRRPTCSHFTHMFEQQRQASSGD